MSSSSSSELEDEELAKTAAAVDPTFLQNYREQNSQGKQHQVVSNKSERYLKVAAHYNDVVVPKELQSKFGAILSALIEKKFEFIEPESDKIMICKIKGGVRLFSDSSQYLNADEPVDNTEEHNKRSYFMNKKRKTLVDHEDSLSESDKLRSSAVTAERILSGDETKHWTSRRKEKVFRYKQSGKSSVFISLQE